MKKKKSKAKLKKIVKCGKIVAAKILAAVQRQVKAASPNKLALLNIALSVSIIFQINALSARLETLTFELTQVSFEIFIKTAEGLNAIYDKISTVADIFSGSAS